MASLALLVIGGGGLHGNPQLATGSIISFILLSIIIGWLPMKIGLKYLKKFEA
jgi:hypothetical protein